MKKTQDTRRQTQDAGRYELRSRCNLTSFFISVFSVAKNSVAKRKGVTLPEMTVVVAIVALMVGLTIPAANMLLNSFESQSGAKSTISAALASARAIAIKNQRYAGIRFQKRHDPANPIDASQYIIFIIQDPNVMAFGFKAVEGIQPIKLPDSIGVMDLTIVPTRDIADPIRPTSQIRIDDPALGGDAAINDDIKLSDTTTFSIIFSPAGKLVIHGVRIRNRNGLTNNNSRDDIFNTDYNVDSAGIAMFYQDDYFGTGGNPDYGLGPEPSRNSFVIYETKILKQTDFNRRWTDYLNRLKPVFINPYTGTIVNDQ